MQSKGLSRIFSSTRVQKHQFFDTRPSLSSNSHIHTRLLEKPSVCLPSTYHLLSIYLPTYLLEEPCIHTEIPVPSPPLLTSCHPTFSCLQTSPPTTRNKTLSMPHVSFFAQRYHPLDLAHPSPAAPLCPAPLPCPLVPGSIPPAQFSGR